MDLTLMFSDRPGTPGRRQQMPRTTMLIGTPALRRFVEMVDQPVIDQRVHLQPDAGGLAGLALAISVSISVSMVLRVVSGEKASCSIASGRA